MIIVSNYSSIFGLFKTTVLLSTRRALIYKLAIPDSLSFSTTGDQSQSPAMFRFYGLWENFDGKNELNTLFLI